MHYIHTHWFRALSGVILSLFVWTFGGIFDIAHAAKTGNLLSPPHSVFYSKEQSPVAKLNHAMAKIEAVLADASLTMKQKQARLRKLKDAMASLYLEILSGFDKTQNHITSKKLPKEMMKRQQKFVSHFKSNYGTLIRTLNELDKAKKQADFDRHAGRTFGHLKEARPKKRHKPLDPYKLPHRSSIVEVKTEEWSPPQRPKFNLNRKKTLLERLVLDNPMAAMYEPSYEYTEEPVLVASNGSLSGLVTNRNAPPTEAALSETLEVQFTPLVMAKAQELASTPQSQSGALPIAIYEWVRNNVEFAPTWGSIQGSDYCLQTMHCNAMDTASLLIALFRANGINARYAQGTIQMPVERFMNWMGGFTDEYAALKFAASGGIPVTGLTEGGRITHVRMEHVWVEAWLDFFPSRGAKHMPGGEDYWVPLDGSFKQYEYSQGIDMAQAVPFDAETFVNDLVASATINEEQGYVTGVDSAYIQQAMETYQTQVSDYMAENYPDATVGDVMGTKTIVKHEFPTLMGTLPYKTVTRGPLYTELPESLRHSITFSVEAGDSMYYSDTLTYSESLPELAGKKITLSYAPATQADADLINSFLPEPNPDGTPIDPSQLPTELPAYLINLKPQLMIEGVVVAEGGAITMGIYENMKVTFSLPTLPGETITNLVAAGEYFGIALDVGRISQAQIDKIKMKLESTKTSLDNAEYGGLAKDDILGDLLYTTAMSYYAEADVTDYLQAWGLGVAMVRLPSEAVFSTMLDVEEFYGTPLSASAKGLFMDVDRSISSNVSLDGDEEKARQFMISSGMNGSTLEQSIPDQLFSTPEYPSEGVSAAKALQIANQQGIPLYTVTKDNIATVLPQLSLDADVMVDIQNAVNAGKEVTVSRTNINFNGWIGCGYIILDPVTGAAGYMISGGLSGGWIIAALLIIVSFALLALSIAAGPAAFVVVSLLLPFYLSFLTYLATQASEKMRKCVQSITLLAHKFLRITRFLKNTDVGRSVIYNITVMGLVNNIGYYCFGIGVNPDEFNELKDF